MFFIKIKSYMEKLRKKVLVFNLSTVKSKLARLLLPA